MVERLHGNFDASRRCNYECSAMLLGVLTMHLIEAKLLPKPEAPFLGYSYGSLKKRTRAISRNDGNQVSPSASWREGRANRWAATATFPMRWEAAYPVMETTETGFSLTLAMDNVKYDLDPQGDVILILQNPNAPFAVWPWGDDQESADILYPKTNNGRPIQLRLEEPQASPQKDVVFRLSSRHLILASDHFKTMLQGPWKEASDGPPYTILAEDWDEHALLHVMNIIHGYTRKVPRTMDLELLSRIAVIVDYYQCLEAVELYADVWLNHLKSQAVSDANDRNLVLRLLLSFIFKDPEWFKRTTHVFILKGRGLFPTLELPIPQLVVDKLELARERLIGRIMKRLQKVVEMLSTRESGCSYECSSMLLGVLTMHLSAGKLLFPAPQAPFSGYSLSSLIKFVNAIREPSWAPRFDGPDHNMRNAFREGIRTCIQSEEYFGRRWWEYDEDEDDETEERIEQLEAQSAGENPGFLSIPKHGCTLAYQFEYALKKIKKDIRGLKLEDFDLSQQKSV
ncbi:hypothetical protein PT974_06691 [Cladobotryum mycophilum]|uniref:BTB domain-containing protein n=1 Tax=Cladobotryum mycophilum TaxID=491253 RepID=A0ABR0SM79_9HYPO